MGTKAPQAAGKIHSDFERGFIRAEVVNYRDLLNADGAGREKWLVVLTDGAFETNVRNQKKNPAEVDAFFAGTDPSVNVMFLAIGFIILARLNFDKAVRQFMMICVGSVMSLVVPKFFEQLRFARGFSIFCGLAGILLLLVVLLLSSRTYGANLTLELGPFAFQPSEFVKISFVLMFFDFLK